MRGFFDAAVSSRTHFPDASAVTPLMHIAGALQNAELEVIAPLVARPEATSWLWRMTEALEFRQASYFEEIASQATRLFFPALLTVRSYLRGSTLPIGRSHERGINLLSVQRRISSPVPLGTRMNVSLLGPMLRFSSAAGRLVEFPAEALMERGKVDVGIGFSVEDLPRTQHGEIVVLDRDTWMFGQYPRGGRFGAGALADVAQDGLLVSIDGHGQAIQQAWPELGRELTALIAMALPLSGSDAKAETAPPFLGAVALTEQAKAADLVEQLGRTKARLVAGVGLAFESTRATGDARPLRGRGRQRLPARLRRAGRSRNLGPSDAVHGPPFELGAHVPRCRLRADEVAQRPASAA